ncbi:MAG: M3 family oligoendopeptidase, partial [Candidatus Poribacteria bacterium]|nr:M3 family oligoendopeptidase [Candidatus Poribacteria bacterium]
MTTLPHWDVSTVYPNLETPQFADDIARIIGKIAALERLFDERNIGATGQGSATDFEQVLNAIIDVIEPFRTLGAFVSAYVSTDSRNEVAAARQSEFRQYAVRLSKLDTRLTAWIGASVVDEWLRVSEMARTHRYMLTRTQEEARHLMSPEEETLAAELGATGHSAWRELYSRYTSQLTVAVETGSETKSLPMSAVRNLAYDPDTSVRESAYKAELAAWEKASVPIAASMNSIKGEVVTLSKRRGWESPLDAALFGNGIDRDSLDALMEAARAAFPDFRRYLNAKATALGKDKLPFYDIFAPVGEAVTSWEYDEATAFIAAQFGTYSEPMKALAERCFRENWVDAEPRDGKRDGAFCMRLRPGESRILMNYKPTFNGVNTLAHELGHAYHNWTQRDRTPFQRENPMVLAETASIFCEAIVGSAAIAIAPENEQLRQLDVILQSSCQTTVDITSRFLFESNLFEKRPARELSVAELNDLMRQAQLETYGDGLDPELLHPYMWAAKPHYYGSNFYNYPYMYGRQFALGLYATYQGGEDGFVEKYDDLLSRTGMASPAELAQEFGFDARDTAFWGRSFDVIRADIDRFVALAEG